MANRVEYVMTVRDDGSVAIKRVGDSAGAAAPKVKEFDSSLKGLGIQSVAVGSMIGSLAARLVGMATQELVQWGKAITEASLTVGHTGESVAAMRAEMEGLTAEMGGALAPTVQAVADTLRGFIAEHKTEIVSAFAAAVRAGGQAIAWLAEKYADARVGAAHFQAAIADTVASALELVDKLGPLKYVILGPFADSVLAFKDAAKLIAEGSDTVVAVAEKAREGTYAMAESFRDATDAADQMAHIGMARVGQEAAKATPPVVELTKETKALAQAEAAVVVQSERLGARLISVGEAGGVVHRQLGAARAELDRFAAEMAAFASFSVSRTIGGGGFEVDTSGELGGQIQRFDKWSSSTKFGIADFAKAAQAAAERGDIGALEEIRRSVAGNKSMMEKYVSFGGDPSGGFQRESFGLDQHIGRIIDELRRQRGDTGSLGAMTSGSSGYVPEITLDGEVVSRKIAPRVRRLIESGEA